jgi:hypothetical protein
MALIVEAAHLSDLSQRQTRVIQERGRPVCTPASNVLADRYAFDMAERSRQM